MNWEAQAVVNLGIIPVPLRACPKGLTPRQSLLRRLRQSRFQAECSS